MKLSNKQLLKATEEEIHAAIRDLEGELGRREEEARIRQARKKKDGGWTIQHETVRCGADCECNKGKGHGPYFYGYKRENGRLKRKYLGLDIVRDETGTPLSPKERKAYAARRAQEAEERAKAHEKTTA